MRLGLGPVLALLIAALPQPLAMAATPSPGIERWDVETFYADFDFRTKDGDRLSYIVMAERVRDAETSKALKTRIYAGIIPCEKTSGGGVFCKGNLVRQEVIRWKSGSESENAELVFASKGRTHLLKFEPRAPYDASGTETGARCYGAYIYEFALNAHATGVLFGRQVDSLEDEGLSLEHMEKYTRLAACT